MDIYKKAQKLAQDIINTQEFIRLKKAKQKIDSNKLYKQKIKEFQEQQIKLNLNNKNTEIKSTSEDISRQYKQLSSIPEIKTFFECSKDFNYVMTKVLHCINSIIHSALES